MMQVTLEKPTISKIQVIFFPSPVQMDKFVFHTSMMGLATIVSIQIGMMHLFKKSSQLMCPYLTMPIGSLTLAVRGLEELIFQLCFCVSFWFWREIGFGFTCLCT
jgi:hypothetical protein